MKSYHANIVPSYYEFPETVLVPFHFPIQNSAAYLNTLALPLLVMLIAQVILVAIFATFITYKVMGKNYEAAVFASARRFARASSAITPAVSFFTSARSSIISRRY